MSHSLPKSFKCCLTCAYWCGMRKLTMFEHYVETDDVSTRGMCANQNGYYHQDTETMTCCPAYQVMPALRDD